MSKPREDDLQLWGTTEEPGITGRTITGQSTELPDGSTVKPIAFGSGTVRLEDGASVSAFSIFEDPIPVGTKVIIHVHRGKAWIGAYDMPPEPKKPETWRDRAPLL